MEATEAIMENVDQILDQIWQQNLMLRELLHQSEHQNEEKIVDYSLKLMPLLLDLVKALSQQLESTTKILKNTCHLLSTVQEKGWQQIPSQEGSNLPDWLLELRENILHTLGYLGEAQDKLFEMNYKKIEKVQLLPCVSGKSEPEAEKEPFSDAQMLPPLSQPFHDHSALEKENRVPLTENKAVETETVTSQNEKISGPNQKYPASIENEAQSIPEESILMSNNKKISHIARSSIKEHSENIDLEDVPGNNGRYITASIKLENTHIEKLPKLAEIKEAPKEATNRKRKQKAKQNRREKDVNPKEKSNKNAQSNQGEFGPTRLENTDPTITANQSTGKPEEEDSQRDWMMKEFFVEVNGTSDPEVACCIIAPHAILENLVIRVVNNLSSLVVDDAEELVSNIISAEFLQDEPTIIPPVTISIPFNSCYRGMYKDIMVKVTDLNFHSRYLTPVSLEGHQGNQKGTFAEIKTGQLCTFSVVSCLKLEALSIPKKGLSRKLSMDPRISFDFPPLTFSSRVTMQLKVQPIEPSIISLLKTKQDKYHSVVSTSPLVHLQHPSGQPFNKSITVILPCPQNPEKKRERNETDNGRVSSASIQRVTNIHHFRAMSASQKNHGEHLNESLKLLGRRNKEEEWNLLDDTTVRNAQNGLVLFELHEHIESLIVIRQSSAMDSAHLAQFMQHLEEDTHNTMAHVILCQNKEDPHKVAVLLVPSKALSLELQSLREEGYAGPLEPSQQFRIKEGEQVHFRFNGNIFASDDGMTFGKIYTLTFHAQRKPRLDLQIREVDEHGNYSSPHFKGTALFYKVCKEAIAKNLKNSLLLEDYQHQDPVCKLALTLPKKEKNINRPQSLKRISNDPSEALWNSLLYWLSGELSEDNSSSLILFLPLHRSTLQFIKLKCPDSLTEQIYEILCFWKKNLPRSTDKLQLLSRYLCKSGRSDLAEELQFMWENKVFPRKIHGQENNI
ncbi:death domain-containing protein 1 [Eublepharis macularius]|uniref:Death domain-containing protein 1 n=1 Tax=Eublepharis macularius TaxID=481883 RepID=A0AA97LIK8_EUBMA|nr:death domain-containing protein 1 [Eublepharis macularius]